MLVICINNSEALAPRSLIGPIQPHPEFVHYLSVDKTYVVHGMAIFADNLNYLLENDYGDPRWYSPHFFELVDNKVPAEWEFRNFVMESADPWQRRRFQAVWGYPELVRDEDHNTGLQNLVPDALAIFRDYARIAES